MDEDVFIKSDIGAQAAWKGFSSQTLYIAYRLVTDIQGYEYYPEDIEDLVVKYNGEVIEAVQVKNITATLTISHLSSTKTSKGGEGFFKRMCSLHSKYSNFKTIKVVYFGDLGVELRDLEKGVEKTKENIREKLVDNHGLLYDDAEWLLNSLKFEKVEEKQLTDGIHQQIKSYMPIMAAPYLAQSLLVQYISKLSKEKGYTCLKSWEEEIHKIGTSIAGIDGYFKEYDKSLIRLSELTMDKDYIELKDEFLQGVSAHPMHIRSNLDFLRTTWIEEIKNSVLNYEATIVKGVSGQGKSALCYRYLLEMYPEEFVFCIRSIISEGQAQNLASALIALSKYLDDFIIYIDVQPGENRWAYLLQELQMRGIKIPILISIRDEDYNITSFNGKAVQYNVIELELTEAEAHWIYDFYTENQPHATFRTFEDAWNVYGGKGLLIEFVYLLTNNQTLTQRIEQQIDAMMLERISDSWLELLHLVCFTGSLGCSVDFNAVKGVLKCDSMNAAVKRFSDEYLLRITIDGNRLEALHPVRANIIYNVLRTKTVINIKEALMKALNCVESKYVSIILMEYFTNYEYSLDDIQMIAKNDYKDWIAFGKVIKAILWLEVKQYVESNIHCFWKLNEEKGKGWLCFIPLDPTGIDRSNEIIAERMLEHMPGNKESIRATIHEVRETLSSLSFEYKLLDCFFRGSKHPIVMPKSDDEKTMFGYSLFWMAKRNYSVELQMNKEDISNIICFGDIQACADTIRGLNEQSTLLEVCNIAIEQFVQRLIREHQIVSYIETDEEVRCKFIPPILNEKATPKDEKNINQYWRIKMLNILQQIYPNKEYIDIELLGVNLLADVGIQAMDYKLHMHKSNRHSRWTSEVNGWVKIRIEYGLRPASWMEYVKEIDLVRSSVNTLLINTMKLVDDIYKKGRYTKDRWTHVESQMMIFREHIFYENMLPKTIMDPYCLYSEGTAQHIADDDYPVQQLLSVEKYKKFRKVFGNVYTSLDNFYNQFAEWLLVRLNKKSMDDIKNPRLAMYNLFCAARDISKLQQEYNTLFLPYSTLDKNFCQQETENLLTMVNVWRIVLDSVPRGQAIAYNAKQTFRKGVLYPDVIKEKIATFIDGTVYETKQKIYVLSKCEMTEEDSLEEAYTQFVLKLREIYKDAIEFSSNRWHMEMKEKTIVYIPILFNAVNIIGFEVPLYKILDTDKSLISKLMIPCELEEEFKDTIFKNSMANENWCSTIAKVSTLKTYLQRYKQVISVPMCEKCVDGVETFIDSFHHDFEILINEIVESENLMEYVVGRVSGDLEEAASALKDFLVYIKEFSEKAINEEAADEILNVIDAVVGVMMMIHKYVLNLNE